MSSVVIFFAVIGLIGWLVGQFASIGKVSIRKFRTIEVGMTEDEIVSKIGRPYSVTSMGEKDLWVWVKRNANFSIWMQDGKVVGVPRITGTPRTCSECSQADSLSAIKNPAGPCALLGF